MTIAELQECLENLPPDTPVYVGTRRILPGGVVRYEADDVITTFGEDAAVTVLAGKGVWE